MNGTRSKSRSLPPFRLDPRGETQRPCFKLPTFVVPPDKISYFSDLYSMRQVVENRLSLFPVFRHFFLLTRKYRVWIFRSLVCFRIALLFPEERIRKGSFLYMRRLLLIVLIVIIDQ